MRISQLSRRQLLLASGLAFAGSSRNVWAQTAPPGSKEPGRLVVVLLRGAYDGLSAFVPYNDTDYYASRPNIAIAAPDGTSATAVRLDNTFALHPALAPLLPLWQQGVLSFVPSAGLPAPNRSHFEAQYQMEIGQSGKTSAAPGWLNKAAGNSKTAVSLIGVGEANPAILAGDAQVKLIPRGQAAARTGVLANDKTRDALMDLYAGNDRLAQAFRQGAGSRMQSAQELSAEKAEADGKRMGPAQNGSSSKSLDKSLDKDGTPATTQAQNAQMLAASNGAADHWLAIRCTTLGHADAQRPQFTAWFFVCWRLGHPCQPGQRNRAVGQQPGQLGPGDCTTAARFFRAGRCGGGDERVWPHSG